MLWVKLTENGVNLTENGVMLTLNWVWIKGSLITKENCGVVCKGSVYKLSGNASCSYLLLTMITKATQSLSGFVCVVIITIF